MDLCIKTNDDPFEIVGRKGFNPCFNGSMYKNKMNEYEKLQKEMFQSLF